MSTDAESASDQEESVEQRLDTLETRVRDLEAENKTLKQELLEEREQRRALIRVPEGVDPNEATWKDILFGNGVPLGRTLNSTRDTLGYVIQYLFGDDAEADSTWVSTYIEDYGTLPDQMTDGEMTVKRDGLTEAVRQRLLPIHEMWIDVREGRDEKISHANERRAARLFGRMIQKASGKQSVGVDATYGTYSIDSRRAREILIDAEDMTESGKSMTVKRAMRAAQRMSKVEDCDCTDLEKCEHGLVVWEKGSGNILTADKERFNAVMANVQMAVEGDIGGQDTDDEGNSSEVADAGDTSPLDELDQAAAVTSDSDDSVESTVDTEEPNTVVRQPESPALAQDQTRRDDI